MVGFLLGLSGLYSPGDSNKNLRALGSGTKTVVEADVPLPDSKFVNKP